MIEERAVVISSNTQYAWVAPREFKKCANCASSCSSALFNSLLQQQGAKQSIRVDNVDNASIGDDVIIGISAENLVWASVLAYLLPIVFLIIGSLIGSVFFSELMSIALGFAGLFLGFFSVKKIAIHVASEKLKPIMIRKHSEKIISFNLKTN